MLVVDRVPRPGEIRTRASSARSRRAAAASRRSRWSSSPAARASSPRSRKTARAEPPATSCGPRGSSSMRACGGPRSGAASSTSTTTASGRSPSSAARLVPHGDDPLPWDVLDEIDGVYVTGGDAGAMAAARRARRLVATPRVGEVLHETGVQVDVLDPLRERRARAARPGSRSIRSPGSSSRRWAARAAAGAAKAGEGTGRRSRCPGRAWTPTARATRSPPG